MSDMHLPESARKMMQEAYEREAAKYLRVIHIGHMAFGEVEAPPQPPNLLMANPSPSKDKPAQQMMRVEFKPATMTLAEAQKQMPFAISLPAWLPADFAFVDEVQAILPQEQEVEVRDTEGKPAGKHTITSMASVHLRWQRDEQGRGIGLDLQPFTPPPADFPIFPIPVPPNSVREVSVNGTPAALITATHSMRVENNDWANATPMISHDKELRWTRGDVQYSLRDTIGDITTDDFLRIANSIPAA